MIVTLTLNPAIDQTLVLQKFVRGDTLRVKSSRFDPGGKGINVSRVIHELGGESIAMGFAAGGLGRYLEQSLDAMGIETDFVYTQGETRTNIAILEETSHSTTILSAAGPTTEPEAVTEIRRRLRERLREGDWLVIAGSIPPPLTGSVYNEIIHEVIEMGVHTVLDADRGPLEEGTAAHPQIVKGNRREFERLVGRTLDDEESTLAAAVEVHKSGVPIVLTTRGRHGAIAVFEGGRVVRGVAPKVRAVSAVGSGDAFLAGVVLTLMRGGTMEEAMRLGIAAGTAAVLTAGTELCHRREVDILLPRVRVETQAEPVGSRN
ncbi:MAG TPA: 1-phosphofructokinase family hexose kinase [Planctomycetaceae bacterium]|nr:1-phosphofructokinase family hexose kinase [Planctomycetaceae bacterium]